jgi:hypothetical protein
MTLVEATPDASSPNRAARANVEHYGDETRETYLNRGDHLSFRVDNGVNEHRFFENGRADRVKQVLENRQEQTRVVRYSLRQDGCTELARELDKGSNAATYKASFDGRPDGIKTICLALKASTSIDVGSDSASSLIREKMLHAAVQFDPEVAPGRFYEAYQDQLARTLRVTVQDDEFGKRNTTLFHNDEATDDARYETAKVIVMRCVKLVVALERELYVNLFPFVADESNEDLVAKQRQRLYELSAHLFYAFDEVSSVTD